MEELYALYLKLTALQGVDAHYAFSNALNNATADVSDTTKLVEIHAVAAIAVIDFDMGDIGGAAGEMVALLDFYEFQQVWQRYRDLTPRK